MKKILSVFVLLALGACTQDLTETAITVENSRGGEATIVHSSKDATRGELIVKFAPESGQTLETAVSRSGATRSGIEGVDEILASVNASAIEPVFTITARNEANVRNAGLHLWYKLVFDEAADLDAVAAKLAKVAEVNVVQFNVKVKRNYNRRAVALDAADAAGATRASANRFSDPYLAKQWHFINTGDSKVTSPTKAGADVNCAQAWELCAGDPSIVVAVVDEGVMYSHEDLAANMWINTAEKNGSSNRDDDGNGYKDDVYGYNFVGNTGSVSWDAYGDVSHGTHVAGTISAVNGNGKGVCGIAGGTGSGDGVKIMSCQIFSGEDGATTAMTARAIQYACDNGAVILQCSWGYNSANSDEDQGPASDAEFNRECSAEKEAIDYFIANAGSETGVIKGGLAIFAAGNEYASLPGYPGGYEPCISVAAMSADFTPSSFSNYGKGVDIAAPGGDSDYAKSENGTILSTLTPPNPRRATLRIYGGNVYGVSSRLGRCCTRSVVCGETRQTLYRVRIPFDAAHGGERHRQIYDRYQVLLLLLLQIRHTLSRNHDFVQLQGQYGQRIYRCLPSAVAGRGYALHRHEGYIVDG